jgi:hypothetical protein
VPKIWDYYEKKEAAEILVLEARDSIQGYIIVYLDYQGSSAGIRTYVPFLAAAPWNRSFPPAKRQFANIGRILVAVAVIEGILQYKDPRLELHSLPDAEEFYRKIKMEETGRSSGEGLKEFRLGKEAGYDLLRFVLPFMEKDK